VDADTAHRIGLVSRVAPAERLREEAGALAARLATGSPAAMAATKRLLDAAWTTGLGAALEAEAEAQGRLGAGADHAEGLAAFREKRTPRFGP
jgi:enoyl-CoA hydratase/carnithine racemase